MSKPKTSTIELEEVHFSDGWFELGNELGFSNEKIYEVFQYGEYGHVVIEVDENLNIIGGRIIPCGK